MVMIIDGFCYSREEQRKIDLFEIKIFKYTRGDHWVNRTTDVHYIQEIETTSPRLNRLFKKLLKIANNAELSEHRVNNYVKFENCDEKQPSEYERRYNCIKYYFEQHKNKVTKIIVNNKEYLIKDGLLHSRTTPMLLLDKEKEYFIEGVSIPESDFIHQYKIYKIEQIKGNLDNKSNTLKKFLSIFKK